MPLVMSLMSFVAIRCFVAVVIANVSAADAVVAGSLVVCLSVLS